MYVELYSLLVNGQASIPMNPNAKGDAQGAPNENMSEALMSPVYSFLLCTPPSA